jgi:hypothetical protein
MRSSASAVIPLGALLLLAACEPDRKVLPRVAATEAAFLNTRFDACDEQMGSNPSPRSVDGAGLSTVLHGTWVVQRAVRDGRSQYPELVPGREPDAHHILVLDMKAGVGLQYEERGPGVAANAFAQMLPAPAGAIGITYLHCGGKQFGAFRDQYVKVSDDPAAGLRALARHTGYAIGEGSIAAAWQTLRDAGVFTRTPGGSLVTAAFYPSVSTGQAQQAGTGLNSARWDMVGEYRGSPAKFAHGQPATGTEGGVFEGVSTAQGDYFVGGEIAVACYGVSPDLTPSLAPSSSKAASTGTAAARQTFQQSPLIYDKIVIGPLH